MRRGLLRRRRRLAAVLVLAVCAAGAPAAQASVSAPAATRGHGTGDGIGTGDGKVTVRVVTEVDADGAYDSVLEPGMAGVTVTLTDDAGRVLTTTTGTDGTAAFTPAASALTGGRYRVEVRNPDTGTYRPAVAGLGTGADVIRSNTGFVDVSGGTDVTYTTGFWEPGVYCQEAPTLVTCGLAKGDATGQQGVMTFGGDFSGASPGGTYTQLTDNTAQQAVFGIGTDRTGNIFLGTSVKRHTAYGPAGAVNAIYRVNRSVGGTVTTFTTLPGTLTAHNATNAYLNDDGVYARVGREGIGDVDVSGDGRTLYAVDLNDSRLYAIPVQGTGDAVTAGPATSYDIPKPAACVGQWHPYGIGVRGERVLVGGVCGAESTVTTGVPWGDPAQLSAHVYEFAGGAFDEIFTTGLDYARGCAYRYTGASSGVKCNDTTLVGQPLSGHWEAWNERVPTPGLFNFVSAPQPMLSDLEIADNGDLVLGFRDRFGDMQGNATYLHGSTGRPLVVAIAAGDILRACVSGTAYTLESNASCGSLTGSRPGDGHGPGGGEFYADHTTLSDATHDQITEGGLVLQPYRDKVWSTVYDPFGPFEQGARRWNSENGQIGGNLQLKADLAAGANLFGKANGLADLELVCDQAPVQVGNRVWYDANGNGLQDPSEAPVPGVVVTLTSGTTTLTATTDARGEWYVGTKDGLKPDTAYDVTFDAKGADTSALPGSPAPTDLQWTRKGAGTDRALDSGVDATGKTTVAVGAPGSVDHTVDAGLTPLNRLGDHVWYDDDADGIQGPGESGAPGIAVRLIDPATGATLRTTTTDAKGGYLFGKLPDGRYKVCFTLPDNYLWTRQNAGATGNDSVVDPRTGCTGTVTLGPGNRSDLTLDAGLVEEPGLQVVVKDAKTGGPLANTVVQIWRDTNGKPGIQQTGPHKDTYVDDCVTGAKGSCYWDLPPGTYYAVVKDVPEGYLLPKNPVRGPVRLVLGGADGRIVIPVERGEPCKGKC